MTRFSPEARNCCASAPRSAIRPCLKVQIDLRQGMALLALVQPGMAAPAELRAFQPVEHEQRALDAPQFLERQVELVLPAVGGELPQHDGRRHGAGFQRRDQAHHLVPMFADDVGLDPRPSSGCRSG